MLHRRRDLLALTSVCLAALMFGMEISSVPVTLPTVRRELGGSFAQVEWVMTAYTLAVAAVLLPVGALADRFGRKRLLAGAIVAFGLASLLCGLASSTTVLIAGRALQGASGGAMQRARLRAARRRPGDRRRQLALGLPRQPRARPLALALLLTGARESRAPRAGRLDLAGMATLMLAVLGLVLWITEGPVLGFTSVPSAAILAATLALLAPSSRSNGAPHSRCSTPASSASARSAARCSAPPA